MINPVLVEVTRGALVESVHRGAVAVATADGGLILAGGNVERPVFARSAIKLVQALPMIESGACDRFGFGNAEIALACGSHTGTPRHVLVAAAMRDALGIDDACLACGAVEPAGRGAARALAASGAYPTPLHHTCSGKHLGFVATALATGQSIHDYGDASHPVQRTVMAVLSEMTDLRESEIQRGTDGCAVPTYALPLASLATLYARIATRANMSPLRRDAVTRVLNACWAAPELVSGAGRTDSVVMSALPGRVYLKTGAEGVYCGAITELGIGFALKIDDGAQRASAAAVMPLIERILPEARGLVKRGTLKTAGGFEAGAIRTATEYERMLDRLQIATLGFEARRRNG
ncbi:MAG: asparaginase [Hyphomicrobiaceae bacterium]|nr:asparaginase [Hyphomicrobiaceae bacterium]